MKFSHSLGLLFVNLCCAQVLEVRRQEWGIGQTVSTSSGQVTGQNAGKGSDVSEYLGIPYAEPPVGVLRFAAPKKFVSNINLNATKFGPSCYVKPGSRYQTTPAQLAAANLTSQTVVVENLFNDNNKISEDCLYLNVWTKPQVGDVKKAVLVWFYGGAFSTGSTSIPAYYGRDLAALEDVVVVSFNYRLNIFGFPAHPNSTYNVGILDQRMAVEWVRDNIDKFGGDPSRITLFGQSAGSASIDYHSYAWASDPIASSFILQSGTVFSWGLPNPQATPTLYWFKVSQNLGCGNETTSHDAVISCMRTKKPEDIYMAFPAAAASSILGLFGPTIDNTIVFANYTERKPAKLPTLVGSTDYEAGLFRTEFSVLGINLSETFWNDFNIQEFTCPSSDRANASLIANAPVWRYRYMGVFPNVAIAPYAGSYHAAELPLIFNTMPATPPTTSDEDRTAKYIRGAWSRFAKDPENGLTSYGWPKYDPKQDTLIRIAYNNSEGPNLINPYRYDADCPFFNVSSTDPSKFRDYPDLGAGVTPTATAHISAATAAVSPVETRGLNKTSSAWLVSTRPLFTFAATGIVSFVSTL